MALLIGVVLAIAIGLLGRTARFDRDRSFYCVVTIIVASYYVLFAVMGGSGTALVTELLVGALFLVAAVAGMRWSLWIAVAALAAHGGLDSFHARVIDDAGVPSWWPPFCFAYDVTAAAYLAWLLKSGRLRAAA
jgi:hypothetical protein